MSTTIILVIVIAVVAVVVGAIGFFIVIPALIKHLFTCLKCKTHFDYDNDVEWNCVKEFASTSGNEHRNNVEVKFTCHCPKCGEIKTFKSTFITHKFSYGDGTSNSKGYDKVYNLEELIKKYYK